MIERGARRRMYADVRHESGKRHFLDSEFLQHLIKVRLFERAWIILDDDRLSFSRLHDIGDGADAIVQVIRRSRARVVLNVNNWAAGIAEAVEQPLTLKQRRRGALDT